MKKIRIWSSDGLITLIASLIGVFLALYLNEWTAARHIKKQKAVATENILMEIRTNNEMLKENSRNYTEMLEAYVFFKESLNSEGEIVTSVEKMSLFKTAHPGLLNTMDSVRMDQGDYKYTRMTMNLSFTMEQAELKTIAWETLKSSSIISSYPFDYLMRLEYIYKLINTNIQTNSEIYSDARKFLQGDMKVLDNLIFNVQVALDIEKNLIELCNAMLEKDKMRGGK